MEEEQEKGIDPLELSTNERTLWLVSRLQHVEDLLLGMADVQKMLIGLLPDEPARHGLREALTQLALSQPPGTMRTQPAWDALGWLDADGQDDGEAGARSAG
ncbi:hypothetical protein [Comamonas flocculans]|uniref:Uncharacterized protein n=1 Tax=Comamonas flocculans TaxID=2597701 RepID=A0A5B8S0P5_9BURK|nr:hypothetical protein [Comamonas flocculans]QEA14255.1 hypothetical protein FOZ74_15125 [Comamonas flocculans]